MATLYSTRVTASGGRHGFIKSEDGILDLKLALPPQLGGKGARNQSRAALCWRLSACFENALLRVGREANLRFADDDVEVVAEIGLSRNEAGAFVLSAALTVTITGVDQETAEKLVHGAHAICPYSNAIRGNVVVPTTVVTR